MKKFLILFLILLFVIPVALFFIKQGGLMQKTSVKNNDANVLAIKAKAGFIASDQLTYPEGFSFDKAMNAREDIGKNAFYYDYSPVALDGVEWVSTKNFNSSSDYEKAIRDFQTFYNSSIYKDGWTNQQIIDGHNLQPLAADSSRGQIYGYLKYLDGSVQVILFYIQKDSDAFPLNAQFRVFLSNIYPLKQIVK